MSGGGGGGYSSPVGTATNCNIVERVPLSSPKLPPSSLKTGDLLDVHTINNGATLVASHGGAIAGSLMPKALMAILQCISDGHEYVAAVVNVRGGRAATALAELGDVELHTYVDATNAAALEALMRSLRRVSTTHYSIPQTIAFHYAHPLSVPLIVPSPVCLRQAAPIKVSADVVLRFGMLEGTAVVDGGRVVYDPQSAWNQNEPKCSGRGA